MKKTFLLLTSLVFSVLGVNAQNFEKMWAKVEACKTKDLPRSAIDEAEKVRKKAGRKGNFAGRRGLSLSCWLCGLESALTV